MIKKIDGMDELKKTGIMCELEAKLDEPTHIKGVAVENGIRAIAKHHAISHDEILEALKKGLIISMPDRKYYLNPR